MRPPECRLYNIIRIIYFIVIKTLKLTRIYLFDNFSNNFSLKPLALWGLTATCAVWWIFDYKPFVMRIPYYRSKFDHEIPTGPLH